MDEIALRLDSGEEDLQVELIQMSNLMTTETLEATQIFHGILDRGHFLYLI